MSQYDSAVAGLSSEGLAALIGAALARVAGAGAPVVVTASEAAGRDQRARLPVVIPQLATPDGKQWGVHVRALTPELRSDAELEAHRWVVKKLGPAPAAVPQREAYMLTYERLLDRRIVVEEVARMVYDPPGLTADMIGRAWNDAVVAHIHAWGESAEGYPAELIATELRRLHEGSIPTHPHASGGGNYPFTAGLDPGAERADHDALRPAAAPADGDPVPADSDADVPAGP